MPSAPATSRGARAAQPHGWCRAAGTYLGSRGNGCASERTHPCGPFDNQPWEFWFGTVFQPELELVAIADGTKTPYSFTRVSELGILLDSWPRHPGYSETDKVPWYFSNLLKLQTRSPVMMEVLSRESFSNSPPLAPYDTRVAIQFR